MRGKQEACAYKNTTWAFRVSVQFGEVEEVGCELRNLLVNGLKKVTFFLMLRV